MTAAADTAKETVLRGVRTVVLGNGISKFLLVAFELLLARALGAADFGLYSIVMSVMALTASLCLFGMNFGAIQFLAIYAEDRDRGRQASVVTTGLCCVAGLGIAAGIALFLTSDFLAAEVFSKPDLLLSLMVAAFLIPVEAVNQYLSAVFRGLRQFANNVMVLDLWRNLVLVLALPLVFVLNLKLEMILLIYALGALAGLGSGLWKLGRQGFLRGLTDIQTSTALDLFRFSRLLFLWNALIVMSSRIFIIAAGIFLTSAETGLLSIVFRLALFMLFFQTAVNATVQAEFARFWHRRDLPSINHLYQMVTRGLLGVAGGIALFFMARPMESLGFFGHEYALYAWVVGPILLSEFFNVATGPAGQALVACERQKLLTALTVFDVVLQFGLVLPLMAYFGIEGAVVGEVLRGFLFVAARLFVIRRDLGIQPFTREYAWIVGVWLAALLAGWGFSEYLAAQTVTLGLYAAGCFLIIAMTPELRRELALLLTFRKKTQERVET